MITTAVTARCPLPQAGLGALLPDGSMGQESRVRAGAAINARGVERLKLGRQLPLGGRSRTAAMPTFTQDSGLSATGPERAILETGLSARSSCPYRSNLLGPWRYDIE